MVHGQPLLCFGTDPRELLPVQVQYLLVRTERCQKRGQPLLVQRAAVPTAEVVEGLPREHSGRVVGGKGAVPGHILDMVSIVLGSPPW